MEFLACDGTWSVTDSGSTSCSGTLRSITRQELMADKPTVSQSDKAMMLNEAILFFALIFVLVKLRRVAQ